MVSFWQNSLCKSGLEVRIITPEWKIPGCLRGTFSQQKMLKGKINNRQIKLHLWVTQAFGEGKGEIRDSISKRSVKKEERRKQEKCQV